MNPSIPELPNLDTARKILREFDYSEKEHTRIQNLAAEKEAEEAALMKSASLDDSDSFRNLGNVRMMRELIPRKLVELETLQKEIREKAGGAALELILPIRHFTLAAGDLLAGALAERLLRTVPATVAPPDALRAAAGALWAEGPLKALLTVADNMCGDATHPDGIIACRHMTEAVEHLDRIKPRILATLEQLQNDSAASRPPATDESGRRARKSARSDSDRPADGKSAEE